MALPAIAIAIGTVGSKVASSVFSAFLASVSEKLVIRLIIKLIDRLVKSSKNTLDNELWPDFKDALLKQIGDK